MGVNGSNVLNRFIYRSAQPRKSKSIVKVANAKSMLESPHKPNMYFPHYTQNEMGYPLLHQQIQYSLLQTCKIACINHYYLKSLDYWQLKLKRGNANSNNPKTMQQWF